MRDRRHIADAVDADAQRGQRTNAALAARAGALDAHVQVLDALLLRCAAGRFRSHLGSERRALARALETLATTGSPGQLLFF